MAARTAVGRDCSAASQPSVRPTTITTTMILLQLRTIIIWSQCQFPLGHGPVNGFLFYLRPVRKMNANSFIRSAAVRGWLVTRRGVRHP